MMLANFIVHNIHDADYKLHDTLLISVKQLQLIASFNRILNRLKIALIMSRDTDAFKLNQQAVRVLVAKCRRL